MSAIWNTYRIEDIADKITIGPFGSRMKSDTYVESGVPVIRGTNLTGSKKFSGDWVFITEKLAKQLENCCVSNGDLVFPHRGSIGEVGLVDNQFPQYMMSSSLMKLRCNPNIADSEFIYYFFKSHQGRYELLKNASQVGTPGIGQPLTSLKNIEIKLPSLREQRKIVKILSDLDEKIHLNNQINQTLESIAQALFKSWFIDFEPVRAKIAAKQEGKDSELAAMCVISGKSEEDLKKMAEEDFAELQATAALFPDELVESELGEVPRGWEVEKLSQNIDVLNGYAFKSKAYIKEGIFVLRTKNFNNGLVEGLTDDVYLPKIFLEEYPNYICEPYDYHMVMVGASIGDTGLIFPSMLPALRNQNMWCFRAKNSSDFGKSYTKLLLDSLIYETLGFASGSAREFFRKGDFQDKRVCVPSKKLLRRFEKIGFSCMQKQSIIFAENYYLKKIRDTLLPKLLSGEIDVSALQDEVA